jgi:hypothetical protein
MPHPAAVAVALADMKPHCKYRGPCGPSGPVRPTAMIRPCSASAPCRRARTSSPARTTLGRGRSASTGGIGRGSALKSWRGTDRAARAARRPRRFTTSCRWSQVARTIRPTFGACAPGATPTLTAGPTPGGDRSRRFVYSVGPPALILCTGRRTPDRPKCGFEGGEIGAPRRRRRLRSAHLVRQLEAPKGVSWPLPNVSGGPDRVPTPVPRAPLAASTRGGGGS